MIKVAICDDDRIIINEIRKAIETYDKAKFTIKEYNSGEELVGTNEKFDVIFLDIDMGGINGIETAKRIRPYDKDVKIIYVTSYTDYMNLAFSVHAFGYLNKPVKEEDIHSQLNEVLNYITEEKEEVLEFITLDGRVRLSPNEIYYFEYLNRKVILKTLDKRYMLKEKITTIAEKMDQYGFYVPHKSFTVNLFHVKSIKGYDIYMMDGSLIPLSQKKSTEFRDEFNKFLEKRILQ